MDKPELKDLPEPVQAKVAELEQAIITLDASRNAMRSLAGSMSFGGNDQVSQSVADGIGKSGSLER